jgi:hypothetical protein
MSDNEMKVHATVMGFYVVKFNDSSSVTFIKDGERCIYPRKVFEELLTKKGRLS